MSNVDTDIAIIGLAGRFPGARDVDAFWANLAAGVSSITTLFDDALRAEGVSPAVFGAPDYVRAAGVLDDIELFSASFFGYTVGEAAYMDPQHRLFMECAWEAMERAGYCGAKTDGSIGVYAGASASDYLQRVRAALDMNDPATFYQAVIANDKDFLATKTSYKLGLDGPSISVQTACSTSLVAIHLACQALQCGECDMALAGGVSVRVPHRVGYRYQEGMILSPDGRCRPFDADASGTVSGAGVGVVVLKRFGEALADGDLIRAVIKGSAINNDGALKVGYTAPSVQGQARVIAEAQAVAGIEPDGVTYVEAHGTGTVLGDPIEMAALTRAFRAETERVGFCAIGSVKGNIGHLDTAAGVAGLIKTVLALEHRQIPPSLEFRTPNPKMDLERSPFFVNTALRPWPGDDGPRRAGISSFGIGGTNSHAVLEEAPERPPSGPSRSSQLLLLSARTPAALSQASARLADHLREHPELPLADVAYTLALGRTDFAHRRAVVADTTEAAASALVHLDPRRVVTGKATASAPPVAFMFPGQGAQYPGMGRGLYHEEPVFREHFDRCAELAEPHVGFDLRQLLFAESGSAEDIERRLAETRTTQIAIFALEYSLAQVLLSRNIRPDIMIGHSLGEYTAACLAGVFSLADGLSLLGARGRLIQSVPGGSMLAVDMSADELAFHLGGNLALAAINHPARCVASGPHAELDELRGKLMARGVSVTALHTSHAFHGPSLDPILDSFTELMRSIALQPPRLPFISNLTGRTITDDEACDASYWAWHMRHTVRFAAGLEAILSRAPFLLLEVGPGSALSSLAAAHPAFTAGHAAIPLMRHRKDPQSDVASLASALGRLFVAGVGFDGRAHFEGERRQRVQLPTYPFERVRCWLDSVPGHANENQRRAPFADDVADWFSVPSWSRLPLPPGDRDATGRGRTLLFLDDRGLGVALLERAAWLRADVITVEPGTRFEQLAPGRFCIAPGAADDYEALLDALFAEHGSLERIIHCWSISTSDDRQTMELGFYSLAFLGRALARRSDEPALSLVVVSTGAHAVLEDDQIDPRKATILGPLAVIPQELPFVRCRNIDVRGSDLHAPARPVAALERELASGCDDSFVCYRGQHRWVRGFSPVRVTASQQPILRENGVYLITGGLGDIGLAVAEFLARRHHARLVLTTRSEPVPAEDWPPLAGADDARAARFARLRELVGQGAEIHVARADVANATELRAAVTQAVERFGALHGVIHAAGLVGEPAFGPLASLAPARCQALFEAKLTGTEVLREVCSGRQLDFCVLMSSLSTVLGGYGFTAYAAANAFMDAVASQLAASGEAGWISVDWDGWRFGGESSPAAPPIEAAQGVEALARLLGWGYSGQVVVSPRPPDTWSYRFDREGAHPAADDNAGARLDRSALSEAYVAPSTTLEAHLVTIWQRLVGAEPIGVYDNFFELGGNSLMATQLSSRVSVAQLGDISVRDVFDAPTVAAMARLLAARSPDQRAPSEPSPDDRVEIEL